MLDDESNELKKSALVISSDEHISNLLSDQLALFGWHVERATTIPQAFELLNAGKWQLIFFSHTLHGEPCLLVERQLERLQPDAHLFLLADGQTGDATQSPVRDVYCELELSAGKEHAGISMLHRWMPIVEERIRELHDAVTLPLDSPFISPIIGECPAIQQTRRQVEELANTSEPCLITGEPGTGKLLVACTLHELRCAKDVPMKLILCEEENEKFGVDERSLLSEAMKTKECGTVFLRQLDAASAKLQAALLDLDFGAGAPVSIIASSCRDLREMAERGDFNSELYRRLKNYIYLPPLRERREDIKWLIPHFAKRFTNKPYVRVSRPAWKLLQEYAWEFNLPQLHNVTLNAVSSGAGAICVMDIPLITEKA